MNITVNILAILLLVVFHFIGALLVYLKFGYVFRTDVNTPMWAIFVLAINWVILLGTILAVCVFCVGFFVQYGNTVIFTIQL